MITTLPSFTRLRRRLRLAAITVPTAVGLTLLGSSLHAKPVPDNLGNGLGKLVESNRALALAQKSGVGLSGTVTAADGKTYTDAQTAAIAQSALGDAATGRLLVRITLNGQVPVARLQRSLPVAVGSLTITAVDKEYRGVGVMNAYVDVADVPALATAPGVSAVILEWRPQVRRSVLEEKPGTVPQATVGETLLKVGTAFDQGVTQHRVDQVNKLYNASANYDFQGTGMQVACISNSYAAHTARPASTDVTNSDLPGAAGNNAGNTNAVFVLLDDLSSAASDDEGRGMVQIAYKMAPKARFGFGTANTGEVGFSNVIRGLAGINSTDFPAASSQGFAADTICDDVGYFDEPFFQDGIIAGGIEAASAAGVAYFSSAGNDIGTNGYDSDLRWVSNGTGLTAAAGNAALAGTNIDLTNVPANLYAGGFHNFNPNGGLDVAQLVNDYDITANTLYGTYVPCVLQWNEPYDQTSQPNNLQTVWTQAGNYTTATAGTSGDQTYTITPSLTAGVLYQLAETANGSTFDGVITIKDPSGNILVNAQDTGGDETARFIAPVSGTGYTVTVGHYSTTTGAYNLTLSSSTGFTGNIVQTQISLLAFNATTGAYIPASSLTTNALTTNQPLQLGYTTPTTGGQIQYVIARANVPTGPNTATRVRYVLGSNGIPNYGPAEYFTYTGVTTGGHAMAPSCNGCAAYSVFRPSVPENDSCGPVTIYYDGLNNRLATPEVRLQPRMAAADGGNVSSNMNNYFASDTTQDPDTNGNFYGTSAAGPHAAAIAALVLQAHGGRRSYTPAQMTALLQNTAFVHDLDPNFASGSARVSTGGKVTITIASDESSSPNVGVNDPNSFTVSYVGGSSVTSFVFNPGGTAATGGNTTGGNNGVTYVNNNTTVGGNTTYFENSLPGVAFLPASKAFTLATGGNNVTGVTALPSNPSNTAATQYYTLTLTIPTGNFTNANLLHFTVGRGVARTATTGGTFSTVTSSTTGGANYTADLFGGGVALPNGTVGTGMTFSGTTADGGTFSGVITNRLGNGWSPKDGFGFLNAEAAVKAALPVPLP